jgi:hypothetical protein
MDGIFGAITSTMDEMISPTYERRKIGRHEDPKTKLFVSTVKSPDLPGYETGCLFGFWRVSGPYNI